MFDPRIIKIGIEVEGQLRVYSSAWITAKGTKFANPLQNEATVQIANLDKEVAHYILTETSPFNDNRVPKRLVISAGRESMGESRIFVGDITASSIGQPPDIVLSLKAKTLNFSKGDIVAMAGQPLEPLSALSRRVATTLGVGLDFQANDVQVKNWSFTGASLALVRKLGQVGGVDAFIDDQILIVKDRGASIRQASHVLSMGNGMVGVPEATEYGAKVKMMFTPNVTLGGRLELESMVNPAMNGPYSIYKLDFDLATRENQFYWIAHCSREGWKNAKRFPQ